MDMQVQRRETDQLRSLILQVGKSVEVLGNRLETQPYGASHFPRSLPALDDEDDTEESSGMCAAQGSPPPSTTSWFINAYSPAYND